MELKHKTFGSVASVEERPAEQAVMTKSDLQLLIELGSIADEIVIGSLTFVMRSLNASERLELSKFLTQSDPTAEALFDFNIRLLAHAIQSVNGKPLESFFPTKIKGDDDIIRARCDIIASMQTPVISKLLNFHNSITERCDAQFDEEEVKN